MKLCQTDGNKEEKDLVILKSIFDSIKEDDEDYRYWKALDREDEERAVRRAVRGF